MNTYTKRLICAFAALSLTGVSAFAANLDGYDIDETAKTITLHGTIDGAKKYDDITIELLKKDKSIKTDADYDATDISDDFLLFTQVLADEKGGYSVTVDMTDEEVGYYTMRVNGKETEKPVFYTTTEAKTEILEQINEIIKEYKNADTTEKKETAVGKLKALLDLGNKYSAAVGVLGLTEDEIFDVDETKLSEIICINADEDGFTVDNIVKEINLAAYTQTLNEGKGDIADYATAFNLDAKYVEAYKRLSDGAKSGFAAKYFKDKNYLTPDAVRTAFKKAVLDALVGEFSGWGDVEYYMTNLGSDAGVNMSSFNILTSSKKSDFYETAAKHDSFNSSAEYAAYANTLITTLASSGGTTTVTPVGGGGGFGGGGIGGSKIEDETTPITPTTTDETTVEFSDLDDFDWAKESIEYLANNGIVNGVGDGMFDPSSEVTREEFLAMLMRAYNIVPDITVGLSFADADSSAWYAGYIAVAVQRGIVNGVSDTEFGVGKNITRQDAAVMAYRIAVANGKTFDSASDTKFADDSAIASYATDAIYAMRDANIINGKENNMFAPEDFCTRAEAAVIIYRLIK